MVSPDPDVLAAPYHPVDDDFALIGHGFALDHPGGCADIILRVIGNDVEVDVLAVMRERHPAAAEGLGAGNTVNPAQEIPDGQGQHGGGVEHVRRARLGDPIIGRDSADVFTDLVAPALIQALDAHDQQHAERDPAHADQQPGFLLDEVLYRQEQHDATLQAVVARMAVTGLPATSARSRHGPDRTGGRSRGPPGGTRHRLRRTRPPSSAPPSGPGEGTR